MSAQDDYTNDMPAECKEIFDKTVKGYLRSHKDASDDDAMEFAKRAIRMAGWTKRNNKWSLMKHNVAIVTREVSPVQVFKAGTWNGDTYTSEDLDHMLSAFTELRGFVDPPVQIGHTSDAFNMMIAEKLGVPKELITGDQGKGAMALGWVSKMWREGDVLLATLSDVPEPLGLLIEARSYKPVSVTVMWDYKWNGKTYPKVINSVSLLGFERQAVGEIAGLEGAAMYVELLDGKSVDLEDAFSMPTAGDVHRDSAIGEDVTEADLEATFDVMATAAEEAIRGRKGAKIFRVIMGELKGKLKNFLPKKETTSMEEVRQVVDWLQDNGWEITEPASLKVVDQAVHPHGDHICVCPECGQEMTVAESVKCNTQKCSKCQAQMRAKDIGEKRATKTNEEGEMSTAILKALTTMLSLAEDADEETIITAINEFQEKAKSGPAEYADLTEQVKTYKEKTDTLTTDLAVETRKRKVSEYSAVCAQFTNIAGTPMEMAERLVSLEEWKPEDAWNELLQYDARNKAQGQVKENIGTPLVETEGEPHEFVLKVKAYQDEKGCSRPEAMNAVSKIHTDLWIDYRKTKTSF